MGITSVSTALGLQCAAVNEECRKELLDAGLDPKQVAAMSVEQIVAIKTQREIREVCDQFQAAALLPSHYELAMTMNNPIRMMQTLQSRGQLLSTLILSHLIPGTEQLKIMDYSVTANHLRLMTIEALRMYAAENMGELPESLEDLKPVPALCDPFTNRLIQYEKTVENGVATVTLEIALPKKFWDQDRKLKVQIRK